MSLLATIIPPFSLICKSSLNPLAYQIRLMEREREKRERVNKGIFRLVSSFECLIYVNKKIVLLASLFMCFISLWPKNNLFIIS